MTSDLLDHYRRASEWTNELVAGAAGRLNARTPCDDWDVRKLLNHMLETERYFTSAARGAEASPPGQQPSDLLSDDPASDFQHARADLIDAFAAPGVVDRTGPLLGIAMSDQLVHGWDLAKATGQDSTMPDGLAEVAYETIHGRFTDEQRHGVFKAEVKVAEDAPAQDKLLAYTGREPSP